MSFNEKKKIQPNNTQGQKIIFIYRLEIIHVYIYKNEYIDHMHENDIIKLEAFDS